MRRLRQIRDLGQQVWLDNISRALLASGELAQKIAEDGLAGVTSNPVILFNAISKGSDYQADLTALRASEPSPERRFERLAIPDIQAACDLFHDLYVESAGEMGYVSFEVSPRLAQDAEGTFAAAQRLWAEIDRPNAMIKIPATPACLPAIERALAAGINVNVTLIFTLQQARAVFTACQRGLATRLMRGEPLARVRAVASVFVSRVDTAVDALLPDSHAHLRGQIAIASARTCYATWVAHFGGDGFAALRNASAHPPALLWASTGTKNAAYRDVVYVEQLIGAGTVNTIPDATLAAFADHGEAALTLTKGLAQAHDALQALPGLGIDLEAIGRQLQLDGLKQFDQAFDQLMTVVG